MTGITSLGIGSGLDLETLVQQLVIAEGTPTATRLDSQQAGYEIELSSIGTLQSALDTLGVALQKLADPTSYDSKVFSSSDEEIFTVSAEENAVASSYDVEVLRLAQAQKLQSGAFADAGETAIGTGTLTIAVNGQSFSVEIDDTENTEDEKFNTLVDIRDAINDAEDNSGVVATIVTGEDGAHLILTSADTGAVETLKVTTSGGDGGLDALIYDPENSITNMTELEPPLDAELRIDGVTVFSASNTVTGAIEGVTLDLVGASPGTVASLDVEVDTESTEQAVKNFVNEYNALLATVSSLTSYDSETQVSGPLQGDTLVIGLTDELRREIGTPPVVLPPPPALYEDPDPVLRTLADIGITVALDGTLELDETVLNAAVADDINGVAALFSVDSGYAVRMEALVDEYADEDGLIESRTETLETSIEDIEEQRSDLDDYLISFEERIRAEFVALDLLVAELSATSDFLLAQLDALPTYDYSS